MSKVKQFSLIVNYQADDYVLASDYDALLELVTKLDEELMSLSQDDGKVERALVSAQERIRTLEELNAQLVAENARLNMEMVAYRQNLTPQDVEAMTAVITALTAAKAAKVSQ